MEVYLNWKHNGADVVDILLGVALFAIGVIGAYLLVRYQRKQDAKTEEK